MFFAVFVMRCIMFRMFWVLGGIKFYGEVA